MRWTHCLVAVIALQCTSVGQAEPARWEPDDGQLGQVRQRSEERWLRLNPNGAPRPHAETREFMAYALDALAGGGDDAKIQRALEIVRERQERDPSAKFYGNIRWYLDDDGVVDRNGVEFVLRHANVLWLLYRDRLTPAQRVPLEETLRLARTGIARHAVPVVYTNIFLMKAWNLIALGEGLDEPALAGEGARMLEEWLDYTARNGIVEYLSPTYYAVDLECLALIRNLSRDPRSQALAQRGLDAVWSDVALNWYRPAERLGGVHSRDYNRLYNLGDLNDLAARAGWATPRNRAPEPGPYRFYAWSAPSSEAARWLAAPLPRMLATRWGEAPHQRHWHYQAEDFSIASSDGGYQNMDTAPLAVNLGSGADAPVITYTMDGRSDYYGLDRSMESGSGHLKSLHLKPFLSSAQRGPEVVFLAHGGLETAAHHTLESTLILPSDAHYWLDGKPLDIFTQRSEWQTEPAANGKTTLLTIQPAEPRERVLLEDRDNAAGIGISRSFDVREGQEYRLRARLAGGELALYLNFYDAQGRLIGGERIQRAGGRDQATDYSFSQTAPAGAVRCRAWVYSAIAAQTRVELSDLAFERVTASGTQILGGYDFRAHRAQRIAVPIGATLVMQRGTAALALRLLDARDTRGQAVSLTLHNDGLAYKALRLTAVHGPDRAPAKGSLAMWAMARGGLQDEAAAAAFRAEAGARHGEFRFERGIVSLRIDAADGGRALVLQADLSQGRRLLREGAAEPPSGAARSLDGRTAPY